MAFFKSKVLCPYCLEELKSKDIKKVCNICSHEAAASSGLFKKIERCPEKGCRGFLTKSKHAICGAELPSDILEYKKNLRFSIIGTSGSGKTTYLTTTLHELRNTPGSPWVITPMNTYTSNVYSENDNTLYKYHELVEATTPGQTPIPQLWILKDKQKMTKTSIPSYSITIFDGAGEDTMNIDPVISDYLKGSSVIIIIIDPLILPGVANSISKDVFKNSTTATHDQDASGKLVEGLAQYLKESCGIPADKLIDKDVAIVFSKIDAVKSQFGQATVMQESPHIKKKGFVKEDADAVDAEIRDWIENQGDQQFLNAIETNFVAKKVRFFGVSSFGQPPIKEGQLAAIMPHRVVDPILWMLSKEGIVPTI